LDRYAAMLHDVASCLGATKTFELQKLISRHVSSRKSDPSMEDIHTAFSFSDVRFHLGHRKDGVSMFDAASAIMLEGIGHIRYRGEPGNT